jgi:capsule polysaccharide modification protein KpsS
MSQNAAYSLLASLGLRVNGTTVHYFICSGGLERCVLGSDRDDVYQSPPCDLCIRQSRQVFNGGPVTWLVQQKYPELKATLSGLILEELITFQKEGLPLGFWSVNSLRWVLRRHTLQDNEPTRVFMRAFILSAWNVYSQFSELIQRQQPQAVVVFNGMFFPEAAARRACQDHGIRVITHEVGIQPLTAFFTDGEATAYPLDIPVDFELTAAMNSRLDEYLSRRFQGDFTMAGIRFWHQIEELDETLRQKIGQFKKLVPVFTNVIFDTSQVHANTIFPDMFTWLKVVRQVAVDNPDTLFVIRAHPDEGRKGKESRESVAEWMERSATDQLPNVVFIDTGEMVSSYELIRLSHFVMVYNSTIGLEAVLMGKTVLTAAKARYTQIPTTIHPESKQDYTQKLTALLKGKAKPANPVFVTNARKFLYKQLFMSSLPFDRWLEADLYWKGYVTLRKTQPEDLTVKKSQTISAIVDAIRDGQPFELKS